MSDEQQGGEAEPVADEGQQQLPSGDWFLGTLVGYANDWGMEFGVTLTIGGSLLSGILIGGRKYFETFRDAFVGGFSEGSGAENFNKLFEAYAAVYDRPKGDDDYVSPPPGFFHLKDAKWFYAGGQTIPERGTLWRGRLDAVDGFTLGVLAKN